MNTANKKPVSHCREERESLIQKDQKILALEEKNAQLEQQIIILAETVDFILGV